MFSHSSHGEEYRAFWADAWNSGFQNQAQVEALLGKVGDPNSKGTLREANCNAVIVQVRRRFDVCYPSGVGEPYFSGLSPANYNALEAMIQAAHDTTGGKKRIEVHCWSVAFKTAKGAVYNQHRDTNNSANYWPTRVGSTNGLENGDGAFDPGHPKVLEYLVNAHMDLVNFQTTAGLDGTDGHIDGIHYDYIRFEAANEGFNPTSVARYNARYGLTGEPSASNEQFKQWRRDQISAFVRQMYARIQKTKPFVRQSGSFVTWNPSPTASTRAAFMNTRPYYDVYSDWDSWMEEGIIDMSVPMTYYRQHELPNDYIRWINFEKDRKFDRHMIIGPGVYLNTLSNAILHLNMTRTASPAGNFAHGFSGYSYRVPYASGSWAGFSPSLVSEVTPTWDDVPAMPWKTTPTKGHMMGQVTLSDTSEWADHATVTLAGPVNRSMYVDGTGFYAFIDLPPGNYTVTASKSGYHNSQAPVNVTIGAVTGNMHEQNLVLNPIGGAPVINFQPQSRTVYQGASPLFSVSTSGAEPLDYQWRFGGTNIAGAIGSSYSRTNVQTSDAGNYDVVITNSFGSVTSEVAELTVLVPQPNTRLVPMWGLAPGARPYLTSETAPRQRGLGFNPQSNRLLLVSRVGTARVYVLDAENGNDLHTLSNGVGIVTGGYSDFTLQMVGAAEDGAIYAGNLTLDGSTTNFKIYRWANDNPDTVPTVAFSGNPFPGNAQRWGDTLDVRGSGTNTQIIAASRSGTMVAIFTTTDGINFTPTIIQVAGVSNGAFGLGLAFGEGNTFWGKSNSSAPLRQVEYDFLAGTGVVIRSHGSPDISNTIFPIGVSISPRMVAGISIETPDNLKVFDLPTNGSAPILIETNNFLTDNDNANGVGSIDFHGDRVYALNANNGILALQILPPPIAPAISTQPENIMVLEGDDAEFSVSATGTPPLSYQWYFNGGEIFGATTNRYTRINAQISDQGNYFVVITNHGGAITSDTATLAFYIPPQITTEPASQSVNLNSNATFTVVVSGSAPLNYQWRFNGTNISGATTNSYIVSNAQFDDAGDYSVFVTNMAGTASSANATLTVKSSPVITAHPQTRSVKQNSNVVFTVEADGVPSPSYQWLFKGDPMSGATATSFARTNVQPADEGNYSVIVSNTVGFVTSSNAMLTVIPILPLKIESILILSNHQVRLQMSGEPGTYKILGTPDLTNWAELFSVTNTNGLFEFTDPDTNLPRRFYQMKTD